MPRFSSAIRQTLIAASAVAATVVAIVTANTGATFEIGSLEYKGLCDASAGIALSPTRFAVINDEDNVLRFFTFGNPKPEELDLNTFLGVTSESDIEGAAQIGDLVYWITSHGRNKEGKHQERRLRFFATRLTPTGAKPVAVEGTAYRDLLKKFIEPVLKAEGFTADPDGPNDPAKAPEKPGSLNIEGLAASGNSLLIGFRNPQPKASGSPRALVVTLKNPSALITASPAAPELGEVFRLDLGGRGVRSLEALPNGRGFLIMAGPFDDNGSFAAYRWDGTQANQPVQLTGIDFKNFIPEAVFVDKAAPGSSGTALSLTVMSDDGGLKLMDPVKKVLVECKDLPTSELRTRLAKLRIE
jgi:hypothetical protein